MVMDFWGHPITTPQLWRRTGRPYAGLPAIDVARYFSKLGLCAETFDTFRAGDRRSAIYLDYLERYDPERLMVLAAVEYGRIRPGNLDGHWVVIVEVRPHTIVYNDPARRDGQHLTIRRSEFMSAWRMRKGPNAVAVWRPEVRAPPRRGR